MILMNSRRFERTGGRLAVALSLCCCALGFLSGCKSNKSADATPAAQQPPDAIPQGGIPLGMKSGSQFYNLITDLDCAIKVRSLVQDSDGNIVSASGVQLTCDGQQIKLTVGKIEDNWLETADFGRFMVKPLYTLAVFATPDQDRKLKSFLAPNANLFYASLHGDIARVKSLLDAKVNVNAKDPDGNTALILACRNRKLDAVRALLASGADVNAKGEGDTTALISLLDGTSLSDIDVTRVLLAANADVNARKRDGTTALMEASEYGNIEVVNALLAAGANVNARSERGDTALKLATKNHKSDTVQILQSAVTGGKKRQDH